MNGFRMALFGAALIGAAAPALAQPGPPPGPRGERGPGMMFDRIDANKDGRVTWEEAWAYVQARFAAADTDKDGRLTQAEMAAARPMGGHHGRPGGRAEGGPPPGMRERMLGMMFRGLDANRDGFVTLDEARPMAEARFRAMDANGDGAVTRDELPPPRPRPSRPATPPG